MRKQGNIFPGSLAIKVKNTRINCLFSKEITLPYPFPQETRPLNLAEGMHVCSL